MNIPLYITNPDNPSSGDENYNTELNQTMLDGLSDNGWTVPNLSTADITTIEPSMPVGTLWFNSTLAKLQVKTAAGVVETITSV